MIDAGFLELVRLGILPADDPDVEASVGVVDHQISVNTPSGVGYYRYGTSAADGSADGYGDCYQPSQTSCTTVGEPWPTTDTGTVICGRCSTASTASTTSPPATPARAQSAAHHDAAR